MSAASFPRQALLVMSGLIVWAVHFLVVYPFNALACARGFAAGDIFGVGLVPIIVALVTLAALSIIAAAIFAATAGAATEQPWIEPTNRRFLRFLIVGIGLLSATGIVWETLPIFIVPPCG